MVKPKHKGGLKNQVKKKNKQAKERSKKKGKEESSSSDDESTFKACKHCSDIVVSSISVNKGSKCDVCDVFTCIYSY
jgi:hypothetical protein